MATTHATLAELAAVVQRLPQILVNVRVSDRDAVMDSSRVGDVVQAAEDELGDDGRILLRPSGTEPIVRVMVEAATQHEAEAIAERVAAVVSEVPISCFCDPVPPASDRDRGGARCLQDQNSPPGTYLHGE
jgi:phosphoglucosamine mutase